MHVWPQSCMEPSEANTGVLGLFCGQDKPAPRLSLERLLPVLAHYLVPPPAAPFSASSWFAGREIPLVLGSVALARVSEFRTAVWL